MRRRLLAAAALAFLWSSAVPVRAQTEPGDVKMAILVGGVVSLATEAETAVSPLASVDVAVPISSAKKTPRLHVRLELTDLPGETVSLEDARSFRSVAFRMGVCQPLAEGLYLDLCAEAGFATRLPTDPGPRDKAVRWGAAQARFGRAGRGWLTAGIARDQRLDGLYRWAVVVGGAIKMQTLGKDDQGRERGSVQLVGDAILGLDLRGGQASRRDIVRVGIAVGGGR
jgi:hypothetical protein